MKACSMLLLVFIQLMIERCAKKHGFCISEAFMVNQLFIVDMAD